MTAKGISTTETAYHYPLEYHPQQDAPTDSERRLQAVTGHTASAAYPDTDGQYYNLDGQKVRVGSASAPSASGAMSREEAQVQPISAGHRTTPND
jgi:hypothetical protein